MTSFSTNQNPELFDIANNLTLEENILALECAQRVYKHIKKSCDSGDARLSNNLVAVEAIIASHKKKIDDQMRPSSTNWSIAS